MTWVKELEYATTTNCSVIHNLIVNFDKLLDEILLRPIHYILV